MAPKSARESILEAAEAIVVEQGASFMTMDAVAARAGVSKGGLIYHFPSQESLMEALIERFTEQCTSRREDVRDTLPAGPARELVAYILARADTSPAACKVGGGMLAAVMRAPHLLEATQSEWLETVERIMGGVKNRERMMVLLLAADCIWLSKLLGWQGLRDEELQRIRAEIVRLAYAWSEDAPGKEVSTV